MSTDNLFVDWTPQFRETAFRFIELPAGQTLAIGEAHARLAEQGLLVSTANTGRSHFAIAQMRGMIPRHGQHWLVFQTVGTIGRGDIELTFGQLDEALTIRITDTQVTATTAQAIDRAPVMAGAKKFLLLIDAYRGLGRVRLLTRRSGTSQTLVDVEVPATDEHIGMRIGLRLHRAERDFQVRFSHHDPALAPAPVPTGAVPIWTLNAQVPDRPGLYRAVQGGVHDALAFDDDTMLAYNRGRLTPLIPAGSLRDRSRAKIAGRWDFNQPVRVQEATLTAQATQLSLGPGRVSKSVTGPLTAFGVQTGQLQSARELTLVGPWSDHQVQSRFSVAVGSGHNAVREMEDSAVVGYLPFPGLESLQSSVVMGTAISPQTTFMMNSTMIGQSLMVDAQKIQCSLHIGQDHGSGAKHSSGNVWLGRHLAQSSDLQHSVLIGKHIVADTTDRTIGFVAIGFRAGFQAFNHAMAIGHDAQPTGEYAIQLGGPRHQVETHKGIAIRADERDVIDSRPTQLGLDFVMALQPKEVRWNLREHYLREIPLPPEPLRPAPIAPASDDEQARQQYQEDLAQWEIERNIYREQNAVREEALRTRRRQLKLLRREQRTSHAEGHYEQALLAQDLQHAAQVVGQPFSGVRAHGGRNGLDVASYRPDQMIPILVRAVQELNSPEITDQLVDRVARRVLELLDQKNQ